MATRFEDLFKTYNCDGITDEQVKKAVEKIVSENFKENNNPEVWKKMFQFY